MHVGTNVYAHVDTKVDTPAYMSVLATQQLPGAPAAATDANELGPPPTGHNCIGRNYIGHNCIGRNHIGPAAADVDELGPPPTASTLEEVGGVEPLGKKKKRAQTLPGVVDDGVVDADGGTTAQLQRMAHGTNPLALATVRISSQFAYTP